MEPIYIVSVMREGNDGLIVDFSDGTTAAYVPEELLGLRPYRELTRSAVSPVLLPKPAG
jgi:hypothetical protein